jgi:hypothetical protein
MPWVASLCGGVWLAGMHWGHWAGEWVVGGAEAKVIAYALIFAGLGAFFRERWGAGWLLLGAASAFHVVTGIWVLACSVVVSWLLTERVPGRASLWLRRHWVPLIFSGALVAAGALPALWIDWGASPEMVSEAAVTQVYGRLGHHLAPTLFSTLRWQSFGILLVIAGLVVWMLRRCRAPDGPDGEGGKHEEPLRGFSWMAGWPYGLRWVFLNACLGLGLAAVGLAIDLLLGTWDRHVAARILKFYWFRWNDVALPMGIAAGLGCIAFGRLIHRGERWSAQIGVLTVMACIGVGLLLTRFYEHSQAWAPFGDRARLLSKWDDEVTQRQHYRDWLEVCAWIRSQPDREGLWLTPRNQQSFKWHTQRAELACNKDMPQDSVSILEWAKRLEIAYPVTEEKIQVPWTTEKLWELQRQYGVRYVLLDQRVPGQGPPLLPILYPPPGVRNDTFSVYEFPERALFLSAP